jgi:hypothetical protein
MSIVLFGVGHSGWSFAVKFLQGDCVLQRVLAWLFISMVFEVAEGGCSWRGYRCLTSMVVLQGDQKSSQGGGRGGEGGGFGRSNRPYYNDGYGGGGGGYGGGACRISTLLLFPFVCFPEGITDAVVPSVLFFCGWALEFSSIVLT